MQKEAQRIFVFLFTTELREFFSQSYKSLFIRLLE